MILTQNREEFLSLIADYCDGTIAVAAGERLESLLRVDTDARSLYIEYLDLHLALRKHAKRHEAETQKMEVASDPWAVAGKESSRRPTVPSSHRTPVLGFLAPLTRRVPGGEATVGGLIVLVIAVAFWGLSQAIMYPSLGGHDLAHELSPLGLRGNRGAGGEGHAVAKILKTSEVAWDQSEISNLKSQIKQGQPLSIQSGLVELELTQGTKLLIEGPAEWTIDGNNNATLKRGKLVAKVPPQATGFTLDTPLATVVDLGTEFGVEVNEQGVVDVQVLAGKVDVNSLQNGGRPSEVIRLVAGEAARVRALDGNAPPAVERIEADRSAYDELLARSQSASPLERWRMASRARRSDATLLAYYDFEDRDRTLRNAVADRLHGQIVLSGEQVPWTQGRWYGKRALAFGDEFATVTVPHDADRQLADEWSFALWLRLDQLLPATTPILSKGNEPQRECSLWVMPESGGTLHFSVYDREGVNHFVHSTAPLRLNRWSFVVGTHDKGMLRLYQNGTEVGTAVRLPAPAAKSEAPLLLGRSVEANYPQHFTGAIDEFALYNRSLNATEIEQFFHEGKPE